MLTIPWQQSALDYGGRIYNPLISLPSMTPEPEPHGQRDHFLSSFFFFFKLQDQRGTAVPYSSLYFMSTFLFCTKQGYNIKFPGVLLIIKAHILYFFLFCFHVYTVDLHNSYHMTKSIVGCLENPVCQRH